MFLTGSNYSGSRSVHDMDARIQSIKKRLQTTPPRCLQRLELVPASLDAESPELFITAWKIGCPCGMTAGSILAYVGMDTNELRISVTPLAYVCSVGHVTELLDTDRHGYHAEVARLEGDELGSAKTKGEGPRTYFPCPHCGAKQFKLTVAFCYWQAAFDLFLDEPELPIEDFFNEFELRGTCERCGTSILMTDLGKL
jgi:hypothetical protein